MGGGRMSPLGLHIAAELVIATAWRTRPRRSCARSAALALITYAVSTANLPPAPDAPDPDIETLTLPEPGQSLNRATRMLKVPKITA